MSRNAAGSRTRVDAFLIDTSLVERTFGTSNTFRPACGRGAYESRYTRANGLLVNFPALAVRAARGGTARIFGHRSYN